MGCVLKVFIDYCNYRFGSTYVASAVYGWTGAPYAFDYRYSGPDPAYGWPVFPAGWGWSDMYRGPVPLVYPLTYAPLPAPDLAYPVRSYREMMLYPIPVKSAGGTKWGYINDRAAVFIPPQYDYANEFQKNGLAVVDFHNRSGLINLSGQYVVKPIYQYINEFSEGRAAVIDDKGFRLIDELGNILTPKAYSYIGTFHEGRVLFTESGPQGSEGYGYMDLNGYVVIPARYKAGNDFSKGKAVVQVRDNEYALIDVNGRRLATYPYAFVGPLSEGLLAFQQQSGGKYGYINEQGKVVIAPQYTGALPFEDGRAVVNTAEDYKNKYGLIDRSGKYVIKPQYNSIELLGEHRAAVGQAIDPEQPFIGSKYALADTTKGRLMTPFNFYNISSYKNGMASAQDSKMTFFIDRNGRVAPHSPKISGSGTLHWVGSLISANVDQRLSYYDRWGKLVWKPSTTIPLTQRIRVKEEKYKPNRDYLVYYPQLEGMAGSRVQQNINRQLKELSQVKPIPQEQLDYTYTGDFQVSFYKDDLLVLQLTGYNFPYGAAHGMPTMVYVHVNLKTGEMYQLKDLFKPDSDYVQVLSAIIGEQIKKDPQYSYVFPDSYKGIQPDQPFFVTEDALHIYFPPYEIGPYAAGFPTFNIPFREISGILNKEGSFWRSFH